MNGVDSSEGLMVWLINYLADQFGTRAILKGGMELRLLDCPRHTNDIDYVFVPFASKNDIAEPILKALLAVPDLRVTHSVNSKCLRCICEYAALRAQIEVNVDMHCESQELTTAGLAHANNQQGRIVRAMRLDVALSHKLAAWNERGLIRDLYDTYFMAGPLAVRPHAPTLEGRLAKSEIRVSGKSRKVSMSMVDFVAKLREGVSTLTQEHVEEHMRDYLPPEELPGLEKKIRVGLFLLLEFLSSQPDPT